MSSESSRWYALYLRSRYEKRVYRDLLEKKVETFLPLVKEVHSWSDRKKKVEEPLFRGYVFVKSNLFDMTLILQTAGVVRFVGIRGKPSAIPESQIEWLRKIVGKPDQIRRERYLEVGERVRVIAGPLVGVEGIIRLANRETRVVISVSSIAQSVSVQVDPEFLERIAAEKNPPTF
jgi:transcription antitermination factor NusG